MVERFVNVCLDTAAEPEELEVVAKAASAFTTNSLAGERLRSTPIVQSGLETNSSWDTAMSFAGGGRRR